MVVAQARILVLDDEKHVVDIIRFFLEHADFSVDCFQQAREAIEAARNHRYDLVILDVVLGDTDGYSVARELKDIETVKEAPILFLSAKLEMSKLFLENFNGRAEFLPKPFKKGDLIPKVDRLTGLGTE